MIDWGKPIRFSNGQKTEFLYKKKSGTRNKYYVVRNEFPFFQTFTAHGRACAKGSDLRIENYELLIDLTSIGLDN